MSDIKKIGFMADSHDNLPAIRAAVERFNEEKVDLVIHAGDLVAPFTFKEMNKLNCPFEIVLGNNDGEVLGLFKVFKGKVHQPPFHLKIKNKSILVLHDPGILPEVLDKSSYDLIIYGHDHIASYKILADGTKILNPGECGGWLYGKRTIAIYNLENEKIGIIELPLNA
ncbi:hypothetical protein B6I21_03860 [candidate division KSB1 bacterium 4572_119]|nr:MAG: hypothetical protein B6I21_03860 [candidate division KSB1 bacterium 4572_119]